MHQAVLVPSLLVAALLAAACQQMPANGSAGTAPNAANGTPTAATPAAAAAQAAPAPAPQQQARMAAVEFRLAQAQQAPNLVPLRLPNSQQLWMQPQTALTRADLQSVAAIKANSGGDYVRFGLNPTGAQKLAALTRSNTGKTLVFSIDGQLVSLPTIGGPMNEGVLFVPVASEQQANNVAAVIAGARPLPAAAAPAQAAPTPTATQQPAQRPAQRPAQAPAQAPRK